MHKEIINEDEKIILNPKKDNCIICGTPLKEVSFKWAMFHGEANASCCDAPYQIKSFHVEPEKGDELIDFAKSLDKPDRIWFKIHHDYIEPIKEALQETGEKSINNKKVYQLATEKAEKDDQS